MNLNRFSHTLASLALVRRWLTGDRTVEAKSYYPHCSLNPAGDVVAFGKVIVPREQVDPLLQGLYNSNPSLGRDTFFRRVFAAYWGISRRDIQQFLNKQEVYQLRRPVPRRRTIRSIVAQIGEPYDYFQMDITELGGRYIFVLVDVFSRKVWASAIPSKDRFVDFLDATLRGMPRMPRIIQSDNAAEFRSAALSAMLTGHGIRQRYSKPYTPQANGAVERANKTLKSKLLKFTIQNSLPASHFPRFLPQVLNDMNNSMSRPTGRDPDNLAGERNPAVLATIQQRVIAHRHVNPRKENLQSGDFVRLAVRELPEALRNTFFRSHKFWTDAIYPITEIIPPNFPGEGALFKVNGNFYPEESLQKVDPGVLVRRPGIVVVPRPRPPVLPRTGDYRLRSIIPPRGDYHLRSRTLRGQR